MVKYEGSTKRTIVKIRLPSDADYERDSDSEWIETWLEKQKFRIEEPGTIEGITPNVEIVVDAS